MMRFPGIFRKAEPPQIDATQKAAIELGLEAKQFLNGPLAKHIFEQAEMKVIAAQNNLSRVDAFDTEEIQRLQNIVRCFDHYAVTLQEIVTAGESAWRLAKEMEDL